MAFGIEGRLREEISRAREYVYLNLPFSGLYRPISESIGIAKGIVVFLYGNPEVTERFVTRYRDAFFDTESELLVVRPEESGKSEFNDALKSKTRLIILDGVRKDVPTAKRLEEFRKRRKDNNRIVFVRPSPESEVDKLSKVGCETTYQSDVFLPFPRRYPKISEGVMALEKYVTTEEMEYLRTNVFERIYVDRRRVRAVERIFEHLRKLTGKFFRKGPTLNVDAFVSILKAFKRYRVKDVPTIQDIIAIVPLIMAPKMLVTAELVKRRLKKAHYYVKSAFGDIDVDQMDERDVLFLAELKGFVVFDVLRFAEGIIKYILG